MGGKRPEGCSVLGIEAIQRFQQAGIGKLLQIRQFDVPVQ